MFNLKVGAKKTKGGGRCNWIILSGKVESVSFVVRSLWFLGCWLLTSIAKPYIPVASPLFIFNGEINLKLGRA